MSCKLNFRFPLCPDMYKGYNHAMLSGSWKRRPSDLDIPSPASGCCPVGGHGVGLWSFRYSRCCCRDMLSSKVSTRCRLSCRRPDNKSRANSLHALGHLRIFAKDFGGAICYLEEALRMNRSVYGDQDAASVAEILGLLGQATFHTGNLDRAIHFLIQS